MSLHWLTCPHCLVSFQLDVPSEPTLVQCLGCSRQFLPLNVDAGESHWFYASNRKKIGPIPLSQLQQLAATGQLKTSDMVLQQGGPPRWVEAGTLPEVFPASHSQTEADGSTIAKTNGVNAAPASIPHAVPLAIPLPDGTDFSEEPPVISEAPPLAIPLNPPADTSQDDLIAEPVVSNAFAGTMTNPNAAARIAPPDAAHLLVAGFEVISEIGRGGMGVVYQARQLNLNRVVALKMILAGVHAGPQELARFRQEGEAVARLQHPNIVQIYDVGEADGRPYFSLEYVDGQSLEKYLQGTPQAPRPAAQTIETLARAIHFAHQRGIVHRDLKPANILLCRKSEIRNPQSAIKEPTVSDFGRRISDYDLKITDFGLAKQMDSQHDQTASGAIMGTPSYMSPEQALGRTKEIGPPADIYALGTLLYELLTGRPPFKAQTPLDTMMLVASEEPVSPRQLQPKVPRDLETICLKCLNKEPHKRYASANDLADDLQRFFQGESIQARPLGIGERTVKWVRRRPAAAALLAVCVLAALSLMISGWLHNRQLQAALGQAREQEREANRLRQVAEDRQKEADRQAKLAQDNLEEARQQRDLATANFRKRLEDVDRFMFTIDSRLAKQSSAWAIRLEFLQEMLKRSQEILKERKKDPAARRQTAVIHRRIAQLYDAREDYGPASDHFEKAIDFQRDLAAEFPSEPDDRKELALSLALYGECHRANERFADAQRIYQQAMPIQDKLIADFATREEHGAFRQRGARFRFNMANILEEANQPRQAEDYYRQALDRQEKLTADVRNKFEYHSDLARTASSLALLLGDNNMETRGLLERAVRARREVLQLTAYAKEAKEKLEECYDDLAAFHRKTGQHGALIRLAADLRRDWPDSSTATYNAACFVATAVEVVRKNQKLAQGELDRLTKTYGDQAVELLHKAIYEGFRDRVHMEKDTDLTALRARPDFQALLADLDKRFPAPQLTPAMELAALVNAYEMTRNNYVSSFRQAWTVAEKKKARAKRPRFDEHAEGFLNLAQKHRDSPTAVDALSWILEASAPDDELVIAATAKAARQKALAALEHDHFQKTELANVCRMLAQKPSPDCDSMLRAALEKHTLREVRGLAGYALALSLSAQANRAQQQKKGNAADLANQAEQLLAKIANEYANVVHGRTTLGEAANLKLDEVRHLSVGKQAPEIEGEDMNGQRLKLSTFRGKVVVLDFWVNWCGHCRAMYPQEKAMVEGLKNRPFQLLGVNGDDNKDEVKRVIEKEQMLWPSWWDGGLNRNRIGERWQVNGYPTIYVLDHKGLIRHRFIGVPGPALEDAVDKLLQECEKEMKTKKKSTK